MTQWKRKRIADQKEKRTDDHGHEDEKISCVADQVSLSSDIYFCKEQICKSYVSNV